MSDKQWNDLPDELKALGKKSPDTPTNPVEFKERVLQEYERRTRYHLRTRWMRRAMTAVTICAAVLVGVLVAKPANWDALLNRNASNQTQFAADTSAFNGLTQQEVVEKYFDLNLQKRPTESQGLLAKKLRGKTPPFGQNRTKPHLTGYQLLPAKDIDGLFQVTLNWATYGAEAKTELLTISLVKEDGRWVIGKMQEEHSFTYQSKDQKTLETILTKAGESPQTISTVYLPDVGKFGYFAADPANPNHVALAREGTLPQIYVSDGKQAQLISTLPDGEIGEMFWGENGLLVVNFTPKYNLHAQELLFVDTKTGEVRQDEWMVTQQKDLSQPHINAVHMLPGNRLRLRFGVNSYIADLERKTMTKEEVRTPQIEEVVYDEANRQDLPDTVLSFLTPADAQNWLQSANIPSDKQIDPAREIGYYLINGSVQSITMEGNDLQVEICEDLGHLQVVRIPYTRLLGMSGEKFTFHVFDEGGMPVIPATTVEVP